MAYEKLASLAYRVGKKTQEGQLTWKETGDKDTFHTQIGNSGLIISWQEDIFDDPDVRLTITDQDGEVVESFFSNDLKGFSNTFGVPFPAFMRETYEIARRQALGTEKVIDNILENLRFDDEIPF